MHLADILLRLMPGRHQFMAAAHAAQAKIRAGAQHKPPLFPAGMGLFHHQNVIESNVHI